MKLLEPNSSECADCWSNPEPFTPIIDHEKLSATSKLCIQIQLQSVMTLYVDSRYLYVLFAILSVWVAACFASCSGCSWTIERRLCRPIPLAAQAAAALLCCYRCYRCYCCYCCYRCYGYFDWHCYLLVLLMPLVTLVVLLSCYCYGHSHY